ncbi:hypothetical protein TNCV_754611 [Trichonephila clavipes]|nr:hypothetical protein TNCV_754611 [Trichonephila clavipes]
MSVEIGVHICASGLYEVLKPISGGLRCGRQRKHDGHWLFRGDPGGVPKGFFCMELKEHLGLGESLEVDLWLVDGRALKVDLKCLVEELGDTVTEEMKVPALKKLIVASKEYEEVISKELLHRTVSEREKEIKRQEREDELKRQERDELRRQERENEIK